MKEIRTPMEYAQITGTGPQVLVESIAQMGRDLAAESLMIITGQAAEMQAHCRLIKPGAARGMKVVITVTPMTRAEYEAEDAEE